MDTVVEGFATPQGWRCSGRQRLPERAGESQMSPSMEARERMIEFRNLRPVIRSGGIESWPGARPYRFLAPLGWHCLISAARPMTPGLYF
jgi:hypothetical protein